MITSCRRSLVIAGLVLVAAFASVACSSEPPSEGGDEQAPTSVNGPADEQDDGVDDDDADD